MDYKWDLLGLQHLIAMIFEKLDAQRQTKMTLEVVTKSTKIAYI